MSAATAVAPEEDFGAAFAEPDADPARSTSGATAEPSPKTDAKATETDPGATTEGDKEKATPDPAKADASKTAEPSAGTAAKSGTTEPAKDVNHWRGKAGWLQGQYRSEAEKRKAVEEENARLKQELEDAKKAGPAKAPAADATPAAKIDPLSRIEAELPETASATREAIELAKKELREELGRPLTAEEIKKIAASAVAESPTAKVVEEDRATKHWETIYTAHPDTDELIKEGSPFLKWCETLPAWMRPGVSQVIEKGTADQVVELFETYKQATGIKSATTDPKGNGGKAAEPKEDDDTAALAVKTKAGPAIPPGKPDDNDFGAAFRD